jgi:hypothetical protein
MRQQLSYSSPKICEAGLWAAGLSVGLGLKFFEASLDLLLFGSE